MSAAIDGYNHTDEDGDIVSVTRSGVAVERPRKEATLSAYWPKGPAERLKLTEAIHGRKIAAVIYEDEMPEAGGDGAPRDDWYVDTATIRGDLKAEDARRAALEYLALARHIEARDAAAKDRERAEEEAVEREVEALAAIVRDDAVILDDEGPPRIVKATTIARRLHRAGVRASQGEGER